jgi:hypothetical protein
MVDLDPPPAESTKPAALQLELPSAPNRVSPVAPAAVERPRWERVRPPKRKTVGWIIVTSTAAAVAGVTLFALVLPGYVRRACIANAAAHGITLAIDEVKVGPTGLFLIGVKATAADIPGASVEAPEVQVETQELHPQKLAATGVVISLDGRWNDVAAAFARWRSSDLGGQGGAWAPVSLVIDRSRVLWRGFIGENARIDASDVHLDMAWSGHDPTVHATSSLATIRVPAGTLGPWRFDFDREPGASRVRIALDPGVPDACTVLVVSNDETVTSADVVVPRSPIARLGIAPALLGLKGNIQIETRIRYAILGPRVSATAKGGLYGAEMPGAPRAIDVAWDATASGDRRGAIDVKDARVAVGPLVGAARGMLKTFDDGFRIDLAWRAAPVPCGAFDVPLEPGQPFDLAYQLRRLAQNAGIAHVSGQVEASAMLAFDSRDLGATVMTFAPKADCGVTLGVP